MLFSFTHPCTLNSSKHGGNCKVQCFNCKKDIYIIRWRHSNHLTHIYTNEFQFTCDSGFHSVCNVLPDTRRTLNFFIGIQEGREEYGHCFHQSDRRSGDFTLLRMRSKRIPSVSTSCNLLSCIRSNSSSSNSSSLSRTILIPRTVITCPSSKNVYYYKIMNHKIDYLLND